MDYLLTNLLCKYVLKFIKLNHFNDKLLFIAFLPGVLVGGQPSNLNDLNFKTSKKSLSEQGLLSTQVSFLTRLPVTLSRQQKPIRNPETSKEHHPKKEIRARNQEEFQRAVRINSLFCSVHYWSSHFFEKNFVL